MNDFSNLNSARTVADAAASYESSPERIQARTLGEIEENTKSLKELKRIADAAQRQAEIAEKEAVSAKKEAKSSKIFSSISLFIGLGSLIVSIIALVLN